MTSNQTIECGIGVREILSGDGGVRRRLMVHCEPQHEAVYVATCTVCPRCLGIRAPGEETPGAVICRSSDDDEPTVTDDLGMRTPVRAVMERDVACVTADVSVDALVALLIRRGASAAAVVDEDGHPVGIVSWSDCLRVRAGAADAGRNAADVMTPMVFSVTETTELSRAIDLMADGGFHQVPVVMGDGSVGGMLSTREVVRWLARPRQHLAP
ncbi:MAG: CBS domain-containing protein [Deltaproteobacteria bacterium]|nr:CBS domain-containing protein [Myxococcales bacterium]MDP3220755.1 CBS domain-containing protein [Deltaproteobacteria bacterium]